MTRYKLLETIRAHTGPIYVPLHGIDETHYVQVVKKDILKALKNLGDYQLSADKNKYGLYVERYNG